MAQGYRGGDDNIPFWELCHLIYLGFGQHAVTNFINDRRREGYLQDIVFAVCEPCEDEVPFEGDTCLICGTQEDK